MCHGEDDLDDDGGDDDDYQCVYVCVDHVHAYLYFRQVHVYENVIYV